jgi:hypothetical protein
MTNRLKPESKARKHRQQARNKNARRRPESYWEEVCRWAEDNAPNPPVQYVSSVVQDL